MFLRHPPTPGTKLAKTRFNFPSLYVCHPTPQKQNILYGLNFVLLWKKVFFLSSKIYVLDIPNCILFNY